jgi:hypothetical protein
MTNVHLRSKIHAWLFLFALLGLITAYVLEFKHFATTFEMGELAVKSIAVSLLLGLLLRWVLRAYAVDLVSNLQLWTACLLLPAFFAPFVGSLTNRLLSPHPVALNSYEFFGEKPFAASRYGFIEGEKIEPEGYYVFFLREGKLERLSSEISRFPGLESGETISIPVRKGLWGFEMVEWESIPDN